MSTQFNDESVIRENHGRARVKPPISIMPAVIESVLGQTKKKYELTEENEYENESPSP